MSSEEGMVASRAGLLQRLADSPDRLEAAAVEADTPLPDRAWSAGQILGHLIAVEVQVWQTRLRQVAVEENPAWTWTEPGFGDGLALTTQELLAEFRASRASTLALVGDLDEAGWLRVGTHAVFGTLDVAMLLREAVRHDDEHAVELERRRSGEPAGDRPPSV